MIEIVMKSNTEIWKYRVKTFLISFTFITICYLFFETVTRILYKDNIPMYPRFHVSAQYGDFSIRSIRPNYEFKHTGPDGSWTFSINNAGFRSYRDIEYSKPDSTLRIMTLGDSHTLGFEVRQDYTYSAILEKYLTANGNTVEVLNTGVSGFSTAEELVFLENEGIKYHPDYVILGVFRNDLVDNVRANLFSLESNELRISGYSYLPGVKIQKFIHSIGPFRWLSQNSYFYSLLFNSTWNYFKGRSKRLLKTKGLPPEAAIAIDEKNSDISIDVQYRQALFVKLVEEMNNFCIRNGITFIVVDIPVKLNNSIQSSLPSNILHETQQNCDIFISSTELFKDYVDVAELHVPHGQNHVSEFYHTYLGVDIGKKINIHFLSNKKSRK